MDIKLNSARARAAVLAFLPPLGLLLMLFWFVPWRLFIVVAQSLAETGMMGYLLGAMLISVLVLGPFSIWHIGYRTILRGSGNKPTRGHSDQTILSEALLIFVQARDPLIARDRRDGNRALSMDGS